MQLQSTLPYVDTVKPKQKLQVRMYLCHKVLRQSCKVVLNQKQQVGDVLHLMFHVCVCPSGIYLCDS